MHLMSEQQRICIVVCYFGRWPAWFDIYLKSCQYNPFALGTMEPVGRRLGHLSYMFKSKPVNRP